MTNPQPSELAKKTRQGASWRLRGRTIAAVGVVLVTYCALAATLLPVWIVNLKGAGELGITGVAAALANAVYHATGKRIRELPITLEKLM